MQIQAINRRAQQKYGNFITAIDMVAQTFDSLDKLIDKIDDKAAAGGFTVANKHELKALRRIAFEELDRLRLTAKKYEVELVSREWRV